MKGEGQNKDPPCRLRRDRFEKFALMESGLRVQQDLDIGVCQALKFCIHVRIGLSKVGNQMSLH